MQQPIMMTRMMIMTMMTIKTMTMMMMTTIMIQMTMTSSNQEHRSRKIKSKILPRHLIAYPSHSKDEYYIVRMINDP